MTASDNVSQLQLYIWLIFSIIIGWLLPEFLDFGQSKGSVFVTLILVLTALLVILLIRIDKRKKKIGEVEALRDKTLSKLNESEEQIKYIENQLADLRHESAFTRQVYNKQLRLIEFQEEFGRTNEKYNTFADKGHKFNNIDKSDIANSAIENHDFETYMSKIQTEFARLNKSVEIVSNEILELKKDLKQQQISELDHLSLNDHTNKSSRQLHDSDQYSNRGAESSS